MHGHYNCTFFSKSVHGVNHSSQGCPRIQSETAKVRFFFKPSLYLHWYKISKFVLGCRSETIWTSLIHQCSFFRGKDCSCGRFICSYREDKSIKFSILGGCSPLPIIKRKSANSHASTLARIFSLSIKLLKSSHRDEKQIEFCTTNKELSIHAWVTRIIS